MNKNPALKIYLDNKNGNVWDISKIVSNVEWQTSRIGKAGSLSFTIVTGGIYQDKKFIIENGDVIRVQKGSTNVFYGYVFEIGSGMEEELKIKAYDQIRYLMANDTYVFSGKTATEIVKKIAQDTGLKIGVMDDTKYKIPSMIEDGKKLLDTICKALDLTLISGYGNYFLYDDFGLLRIMNIKNTLTDFYIGDKSLMHNYDFTQSIDSESYNYIKVVQDNKKMKNRNVYIAKDSANIAKWGKLQLYQSVDENLNEAQVKQILDTLIQVKNKQTKQLKIEAIGDIRVRAGCYVHIVIKRLGINQPMLIDECSHKFEGSDHTMSLELKVI